MSACTDRHTFQLQHDMETNTTFQVKLFGMELVAKCRIQASLLVATGMVSSLKSQLSCFLSRPTWNISISQWHALLDRNTHCKSLLFLFEKRCPVPLLLMASIEQLLLVWTCFKSRAGCICECSLVESCLLHTKPKEGEWDVPRVNPCKKQREHVRIKISPCKIDVDPSPSFYIISTGIVESTRHGLLPKPIKNQWFIMLILLVDHVHHVPMFPRP